MSTHVDGAPPSVSPDPDDGEPGRQSSGLDDGSQWVRAEIQRRMAANRSTRGRHARRGAAASADGPAERETPEGLRRDRVGPGAPSTPQTGPRGVPQTVPQTVPLPPPGFVAAGDLPENYVPRHSVRTPGPAAEPAAPISGPIPIVRPSADGPDEPRRAPVGGPSLPPTGMPLPVRRKRSGPGTPLPGEAGAAGPWSRPNGPVVPSEPVQRLGAPPGVLGGADPLPSWGAPGSPPRGFAAAPAGVGAATDERASGDDAQAPEVAGSHGEAAAVAVGSVDAARALADLDGARAGPRPADPDTDDTDTDTPAARDDAPPPAPSPAACGAEDGTAGGVDLAEVTTAVLPVVDDVPPPARLVGISVQRPSGGSRTVAPRSVTPRNIPVVGTAPPEPGSTRVRVVLSERKGVARPVRTIKEVQEGTAVGELLRRNLIRSQLMVTLRFGGLALLVLGTLPAILTLLPTVGRFDVLGLRLPWLLLGVLMYPFLVGLAWRYTRVADRVEQSFADHVQD